LYGCLACASKGVDDGVDVLACDAILHVELALTGPPAAVPEDIVPALMRLRAHKVSVSLDTLHITML
jgi:hypothetical protein